MLYSFRAAVAVARREQLLYAAALLSEKTILEAFDAAGEAWRSWIYTPATTVWVFLSQCLSMDHSCREAVARLLAWRVQRGQPACSAETGGYCTARDHLPEAVCRQLLRQTGAALDQKAPAEWLWQGRRVKVTDGATITMPDTKKNQAEYPQPSSQKPGCGFPMARIVVVFSLVVGTVLDAAIGRYAGKRTGENSLFRTLHDCLEEGDVLLADRYFSGWFDIALLLERGVDVVVRKHQLRATDFCAGRPLGEGDQLVCWRKPQRPEWMSIEVYQSLPAELELREVGVRVVQPGFRTRELVVVTTLLDAEAYPAQAIAGLYRQRWHCELYLRSIKTVLQMDHLRCTSPHRVRNEFFMHLVAYNLVRGAMAQAAQASGVCPHQVSFKGTLQTLGAFLPLLASTPSLGDWWNALLRAIATHAVADRPDRYEPRGLKRRKKKYPYLHEPRANYRNRAA